MPKYTVKSAILHGVPNEAGTHIIHTRLEPGEEIELTEKEAAKIAHALELTDKERAKLAEKIEPKAATPKVTVTEIPGAKGKEENKKK